jgi:hypothetical protein
VARAQWPALFQAALSARPEPPISANTIDYAESAATVAPKHDAGSGAAAIQQRAAVHYRGFWEEYIGDAAIGEFVLGTAASAASVDQSGALVMYLLARGPTRRTSALGRVISAIRPTASGATPGAALRALPSGVAEDGAVAAPRAAAMKPPQPGRAIRRRESADR